MAALIAVATIPLGIVFLAGCGQSASRQELVKQLIIAKAAVQTGISPADLNNQERQLRASAELANQSLSGAERHLIEDAIGTIETIRTAWNITEDNCHGAVENPSFIILRSTYLESAYLESQQHKRPQLPPSAMLCIGPDRNRALRQQFMKLGAAAQFDAIEADNSVISRASLFAPLLSAYLSRLQTAIDSLA
jgi:hypothetical protein